MMSTMMWIGILGLCLVASPVAAITLDGGPEYTPPGAGTETTSGDAASAGGFVIGYTNVDTTQTENLYFGIRADLFQNGYSMDGPGFSASEIFRFESLTNNSIVYVGETTLVTTEGTFATPTRMTLTFSGTGQTIRDATTVALDDPANGDVGALWMVGGDTTSESFQVTILIEAQVPPFDPNAGNYEPGNDLFNRFQTQNSTASSFDWAFYWQDRAPAPVPGLGAVSLALLALALATTGLLVAQRAHAG